MSLPIKRFFLKSDSIQKENQSNSTLSAVTPKIQSFMLKHSLRIFFTLLPLVLLFHPFKLFFSSPQLNSYSALKTQLHGQLLYASIPDCLGVFDSSYSCGSLLLISQSSTFSKVMNFCGLPVSMSRL